MKNPFTGLRAILFDLDGTLIETRIDFDLMKRETLRLARSAGIDAEGAEALDVLSIVEGARKKLGGEAGDAFRARAFALLEEIEISHCANPVDIPGASELLQTLDGNGVAVGIVTRNCRRVSERLVERGDLPHRALLTRDDVPRTKPDPAHLLAALASMGFASSPDAPTPCAMVGDHWMDVQGGRAAGMRTVGLLRGRDPSFFAPATPDLLADELVDLLPLAKAA